MRAFSHFAMGENLAIRTTAPKADVHNSLGPAVLKRRPGSPEFYRAERDGRRLGVLLTLARLGAYSGAPTKRGYLLSDLSRAR